MGLLYRLPVLISFRGWVDPKAKVNPEGLFQYKIPRTPSGIHHATLRLVAQGLNQTGHGVPLVGNKVLLERQLKVVMWYTLILMNWGRSDLNNAARETTSSDVIVTSSLYVKQLPSAWFNHSYSTFIHLSSLTFGLSKRTSKDCSVLNSLQHIDDGVI